MEDLVKTVHCPEDTIPITRRTSKAHGGNTYLDQALPTLRRVNESYAVTISSPHGHEACKLTELTPALRVDVECMSYIDRMLPRRTNC